MVVRNLAVVAACVAAIAACSPSRPSPHEAGSGSSAGDAAGSNAAAPVSRMVDASVATRWNLLGSPEELCLSSPTQGLRCGSPTKKDGHLGWTAKPVDTAADVVEVGPSRSLRSADGRVRLGSKVVLSDAASVAAFPYVLLTSGQVVAVEGDDGEDVLRARRAALAKLPPALRVMSTAFHACALTVGFEVWCWIEPRFWFAAERERTVPSVPTRIAFQGKVAEMFVQPWLTVCARLQSGGVACTTPPATDRCDLAGPTTLRCARDATRRNAYDPRGVFARPPTPLAIDDAVALAGFRRMVYTDHDTASMTVTEHEEGGCVRTSAGGIRCFVRDPCEEARPWRTFDVDGAPKTGDIVLGSDDGYVAEGSALATWSRKRACNAPFQARRVVTWRRFDADVTSATGGVFAAGFEKAFYAIDCATLASGEVSCWSGAQPVSVRVAP